MPWVIGGALALAVFWYLNRAKNAQGNPGNVTELAPLPAPALPTPTLCQSLVTVGAGIGGASQGVPPQVGLTVGAAVSGPACKMGKSVGKVAVSAGKAVGRTVVTASKASVKGAVLIAKQVPKLPSVAVAKIAITPAKVTIKTAGKIVTKPTATAKTAVKTAGKVANKINPFKW